MGHSTLHQRILCELVRRHYDQRLINNVHRSDYVECMVALMLGNEWELSEDRWHSFDCQHVKTKKRMEIKQSARAQAWDGKDERAKRSGPRFKIKPRGSTDLYVFAWNGEYGNDANHCNPDQWEFFVVAERYLPIQQSIGLNPLKRLVSSCTIADLKSNVESLLAQEYAKADV